MSSFSIASLSCWIWLFSWLPSLVVTEQEMTCRHNRSVTHSQVPRDMLLCQACVAFNIHVAILLSCKDMRDALRVSLTGRETPQALPRAALEGTNT